jgi:hypothetical protein
MAEVIINDADLQAIKGKVVLMTGIPSPIPLLKPPLLTQK